MSRLSLDRLLNDLTQHDRNPSTVGLEDSTHPTARENRQTSFPSLFDRGTKS